MTQHNHRNAMPVNKTDKPGFASVLFTWLLPYLCGDADGKTYNIYHFKDVLHSFVEEMIRWERS